MLEETEALLSFAEKNLHTLELSKLRGVANAIHPAISYMDQAMRERFRVIEDHLRQKLAPYRDRM